MLARRAKQKFPTTTYWLGACASAVDEGVDRGGVVDEVDGEVLNRGGVAVVHNALAEVVRDNAGLVVGHARRCVLVTRLAVLFGNWSGYGSNGEKAGGEGEGTHYGGIRC